jgi:hypothetical protein
MPPKSRKRKKKVEEEDLNEAPPAKRRKEGNNEEEDGDDESKTDVKEQKQEKLVLAPKKDIRDTELVLSLDKDLVCCICLHLMDDPHSFPCGHSFCKGSLMT